MSVKLGSALYKFRKDKGLLDLPKVTPVKSPKASGVSRLKSPANWSHPTHGDFFNITATDLVSMFPQLKLDHANLSRVKNGQQKIHKGWTVKKDSKEVPLSQVVLQSNVTNISDYSDDLTKRGA